MKRVYKNDEKGDVPSECDREWRVLESLSCLKNLARQRPVKWERVQSEVWDADVDIEG